MLQSIPGGFQKFISKGKRKKNGEHVPNHWSGLPIEGRQPANVAHRSLKPSAAFALLSTSTVNVNCHTVTIDAWRVEAGSLTNGTDEAKLAPVQSYQVAGRRPRLRRDRQYSRCMRLQGWGLLER